MNTANIATWNPSDPAEPAIMENGRPENPRAHAALLDYLRLGPGRTLQALLGTYRLQTSPPTSFHGTLRKWSSDYAWPARAARYDRLENERLQAEISARREALLQSGMALEHERIDQLTDLYEKLRAVAAEPEAFWVKRVQLLRYPDDTWERVELRYFNEGLVRQLRGLLDDIASETGGRPLRLPARSAPEEAQEPAYRLEDYSLEVFTPEERAEFIRLQEKFFSQAEGKNAKSGDNGNSK